MPTITFKLTGEVCGETHLRLTARRITQHG